MYHILEIEVRILKGTFVDPVRPNKPFQTIATDDIGAFVALAFERPKDFIGLELEIAAGELTTRPGGGGVQPCPRPTGKGSKTPAGHSQDHVRQ